MLHRRAVALVVALVVGMLALPAGDAAARSSLLQLDPSSGPVGISIRVTPIFKTPGGCTASWDGQPRGSFPCGPDANGVLGWTALTAQGPPGLHTVTVCQPSCDDVDSPSVESTSFTVLAVVPDLGSLSLADAGQRLERAGLVLGTVQGPSDDPAAQVSSQAPLPGAAVGAGSAVNVTMTLPARCRSRCPTSWAAPRRRRPRWSAPSSWCCGWRRARAGCNARIHCQVPMSRPAAWSP
jgi:PASTA domain